MVAKRDSTAFDLLGKRWSALIVKDLIQGPRRFRELLHSLGRINDKVLSQRLKELEARGIIHRQVFAEVPVRVEYSLTDKGRALAGVIHEMEQWDETHAERTVRTVDHHASLSPERQATGIVVESTAMHGNGHTHSGAHAAIATEDRAPEPLAADVHDAGASSGQPSPKISFWKRLGL